MSFSAVKTLFLFLSCLVVMHAGALMRPPTIVVRSINAASSKTKESLSKRENIPENFLLRLPTALTR